MNFVFSRTPRLEFGPGSFSRVPSIVAAESSSRGGSFGALVLVTGGSSFQTSPHKQPFLDAISGMSLPLREFFCPGEPSRSFVDAAVRSLVAEFSSLSKEIAVVAVGGGSALDAGKAIAAMLPLAVEAASRGEPVPTVADFLEGVGTRPAPGRTCFLIACPTTAGTGSEATKNAVISEVGPGGFKKSLRHEAYIPAVAVVDGALAVGCPPSVTAASGLDALTQLLEAWTSTAASPLTDALCQSGVAAFARSFERVLQRGDDVVARQDMAYAAYLSGVALANAGLGAVHALASPVGGHHPIPHGVVCGLLLEPATRLNIERLRSLDADRSAQALGKYAHAGLLLASRRTESPTFLDAHGDRDRGLAMLLEHITRLSELAKLPRFASYGVTEADLPALSRAASSKTNPVPLTPIDYERLLRACLN